MSKPQEKSRQAEFFKTRILDFIDESHPLVILEKKLDWKSLEAHFDRLYSEGKGRPPLPVRLIIGLHLLKYLDNLSDETVVAKFVENPYYQHFCGNMYFEHELPCDPTSMTRWRQRKGYKGFENLLKETIDLAKREKLVSPQELEKVYVDTTVQEKKCLPAASVVYSGDCTKDSASLMDRSPNALIPNLTVRRKPDMKSQQIFSFSLLTLVFFSTTLLADRDQRLALGAGSRTLAGSATEMIDLAPSNNYVEFGGNNSTQNLTISPDSSSTEIRNQTKINKLRLFPILNFNQTSVPVVIGLDARQLWITNKSAESSNKNSVTLLTPKVTYSIQNFSIGLSYDYDYFSETNYDYSAGRIGIDFRLAQDSITFALGAKPGSISTKTYNYSSQNSKNSSTVFVYQVPEVFAKVQYAMNEMFTFGLLTRYLDFNRKNSEYNPFFATKLGFADRVGASLSLLTKISPVLGLETALVHKPATDLNPKLGWSPVTTDQLEVSGLYDLTQQLSIGAQAAYGLGNGKWTITSSNGDTQTTVKNNQYNFGIWLAANI